MRDVLAFPINMYQECPYYREFEAWLLEQPPSPEAAFGWSLWAGPIAQSTYFCLKADLYSFRALSKTRTSLSVTLLGLSVLSELLAVQIPAELLAVENRSSEIYERQAHLSLYGQGLCPSPEVSVI